MSIKSDLLRDIDAFLIEQTMPETVFGLECMNDVAFVSRLRAGSDPRSTTVDRCYAFMRRQNRKPKRESEQQSSSA